MSVKKKKEYTLQIQEAAYEGKGFGKIDDFAIFVKNAAPGDTVRVQIGRKRKKFAEGRLLEVVEAGPSRITPKCSHAETCGGCSWQHVTYEEQLDFKSRHVGDHLRRIGGLNNIQTLPTLGAEDIFHYRNKMEYTFGSRRWLTDDEINSDDIIENKDFALGMHIPGRFDRILNLKECHLQIPVSFEIMDFVRSWAIDNEVEPFNPHQKTGFFRNLMIKNAVHTGDLMVNLVTNGEDDDILNALTENLITEFPEITTVVNNVNDTPSPTSEGRIEKVYHGSGYITEHIGKYKFLINANTFFQTNTKQAEKLYQKAVEYADIQSGDNVYDLYCGVGSLTLFLSDFADSVTGIEISKSSVEKARQNANENNVSNCTFEVGDMKDAFTDDILSRHGAPDVIITDPPRAGMHPDVVAKLVALKVPKLVYISCNSSTLARDLAELEKSYTIEEVQPVDMFPQTYHIETVVKLRAK